MLPVLPSHLALITVTPTIVSLVLGSMVEPSIMINHWLHLYVMVEWFTHLVEEVDCDVPLSSRSTDTKNTEVLTLTRGLFPLPSAISAHCIKFSLRNPLACLQAGWKSVTVMRLSLNLIIWRPRSQIQWGSWWI